MEDRYEHDGYPLCYRCGEECSGDVTESVDIDGQVGEFPICDIPEDCPACK